MKRLWRERAGRMLAPTLPEEELAAIRPALDGNLVQIFFDKRVRLHQPHLHRQIQIHKIASFPCPTDFKTAFRLRRIISRRIIHPNTRTGRPAGNTQFQRKLFLPTSFDFYPHATAPRIIRFLGQFYFLSI